MQTDRITNRTFTCYIEDPENNESSAEYETTDTDAAQNKKLKFTYSKNIRTIRVFL
jgi:hypothetical protein